MSKSLAERAAEARAKAAQLEAEAVIKDPDGHFPYKREDAVRAGISDEMADLSERLLAAQKARIEDPTNDELVLAEQELASYAQRAAASRRPVPEGWEEAGVDEDGFRVLTPKASEEWEVYGVDEGGHPIVRAKQVNSLAVPNVTAEDGE